MLAVIILAILVVGQVVMSALLVVEYLATKRRDQLLFAALAAVVVVWMISSGALLAVDTPGASRYLDLLTWANRLVFISSCVIALLVHAFSFEYPARQQKKLIDRGLLIVGGLLSLGSLHPVISGSFAAEGDQLTYHYSLGIVLIGLFVAVCVARGLSAQRSMLRKRPEDPILRAQARTLQMGVLLTFAHALVFIILLPLAFGQQAVFYAVGYAAPCFMTLFTAYSLVRHRLFDVRVFAARTLAYALSLGVVIGLYILFVVFLLATVFDLALSTEVIVVFAVASVLIVALLQPLGRFFNKLTNSIFFRNFYDPQDVADRIGSILVKTVNLAAIQSGSSEVIKNALKAESVEVILAEKIREGLHASQLSHLPEGLFEIHTLAAANQTKLHDYLQERGIVAVIKLQAGKSRIGLLALGRRKSGEGYGSRDRRMVSAIADQLSIGIQNALQFEEIQRFNERLKQEVQEATRELQEANERLKVLDRNKDDFISMASHQLRTPLTSVKGYLSMVLEGDAGKLTAVQRKMIEQAFTSSQRMTYLISDLLNLSRLKTGKFVISATDVSLAELVKQEIAQLERMADAGGVELEVDMPAETIALQLDETKVRQVIMNLVDNAIYYTPRGGKITVRLQQTPKAVELRVIDTGIGVPKDEQHKLFTRFYRAANAKKTRPDGTGIGLYMVKKAVVAMGGAVIFDSTEGKGSTFGFSFPIK